MNHCGTKKIETERLILRRFDINDADAMYKNWASDPEVTKYLTWPTHTSVEVTKLVLNDWINSYDDDKFYQWAIVLKENGDEPIGSISVVNMNDKINMLEIGYCIGREFWNKKISSEALSGLIKFFFAETDVNRIEARYDVNNPNSGRVMKKCGMTYEGTFRKADVNNQGICDAAHYSILRAEYDK